MGRLNKAIPPLLPSSASTTTTAAPGAAAANPKPSSSPTRPGTSGTELNLRTNREQAATAFQRAQQAEQAYRAKRRARAARQDAQAAKEHLRDGVGHLGKGFRFGWAAVRALPAVVREKRDGRRERKVLRERERMEIMKRKLDVELAGEGKGEEIAVGGGGKS